MMDSAAYFLISPPSSTPSPCAAAAAAAGPLVGPPATPLALSSLAELDFANDHLGHHHHHHHHNHSHHNHNHHLQQRLSGPSCVSSHSSPFLNYSSPTSLADHADAFDPFEQPLHSGDFFDNDDDEDDDDDRHLLFQAGLGHAESPSLIGLEQFGGLLAGGDHHSMSASHHSSPLDDACDELLGARHHLPTNPLNQGHNRHHHHQHHRNHLHNQQQLQVQQRQHQHQQQQQHLHLSQGFQSQDNLAFMSAMSGSLSSGSSDCSLSLGPASASVYDDPADMISSNSNDFYSNYYNLNDCLQSDTSLTSHQQQQYTNNNNNNNNINNFFNCTNNAAAGASAANATNGNASANAANATTEKRSVLMNLLLDGSDIGAGYTSINCRGLGQNCPSAANNVANGFLGSALYSHMD